mgnify:CR=1 FL=1
MEHEQGVDRIIMMCIAARNNDAIEGDESYLLQAKLIEIGLWRIAQVLAAADTEHHLTAAGFRTYQIRVHGECTSNQP